MLRFHAVVCVACSLHGPHQTFMQSDDDDAAWMAAYRFAAQMRAEGSATTVQTWTTELPLDVPPSALSRDTEEIPF